MYFAKPFRRAAPFALAILAIAGQADAASPFATLTIDQYDSAGNSIVRSWSENMSGLINLDAATGDIALRQGTAGETFNSWSWQTNATTGAGYWNWHSAQTLDGTTPAIPDTTTGPWMSVAQLNTIFGHGDPDLSYGFFAKNNTATTQTYTFTIGEAIVPPVSGATIVRADFGATLTNPTGNLTIAPVSPATKIQQFFLSSDGGTTFVNAGVDVGNALTTSASGTSTYPTTSFTTNGPAGSWNFMQIVTRFTLSPDKDVAAVSGFASIEPVAPVPEPSTYAMMAAGLCMLGFMARRRSR